MLHVKKEVQRNDWFIDYLKGELHSLGFHTTQEFSHNKYSIFGKSRSDFAFFKQSDSWIKAGIIMQEELMNINLNGAAIEFKMNISQGFDNVLPQAFADMVRVSNNLLIDALRSGKIVDSITVYGLLVSYNKDYTFPLKYFVDFTNNSYKMEVGKRGFFHKAFSVVVFIGLLG